MISQKLVTGLFTQWRAKQDHGAASPSTRLIGLHISLY